MIRRSIRICLSCRSLRWFRGECIRCVGRVASVERYALSNALRCYQAISRVHLIGVLVESLCPVFTAGVSVETVQTYLIGPPLARRLVDIRTSTTIARNLSNVTRPDARFGQAHQPMSQLRLRQDCFGRTIDKNPTRLPVVRAVSDFGSVQDWAAESSDGRPVRSGRASTWSERCNLPPLPVEKVRMDRP
jgi:hypothetical protein